VLQALKGAKLATRSPLRHHIESELAAACQHHASGILLTLPFASNTADITSTAANMLRKALTIYERHRQLSATSDQPEASSHGTEIIAGAAVWRQVLEVMETWQLTDCKRSLVERIVKSHLSLLKVASLQLQCMEAGTPDTCAPVCFPLAIVSMRFFFLFQQLVATCNTL
jgi:hypothetical protein